MINRFRISISQPTKIGQFIHDKYYFILLYILALSAFCSIPTIINVSMYNGFTTEIVSNIELIYDIEKEANTDNIKYIPDAQITNHVISGEKGGFIIGIFGVGINQNMDVALISLNFVETSVDVKMGQTVVRSYSYERLLLDNIDFTKISDDEITFRKMINALEYIVDDTRALWTTFEIANSIVGNFVTHLISALVIAILVMMISIIPFKYLFKLAIYAVTIEQIFILFSILFDISIIRTIGYIVALVFMIKSLKNIIAIKR